MALIVKDVLLQFQTLLCVRWGDALRKQGIDPWRELNLSTAHKEKATAMSDAVSSGALIQLQGWFGHLGPEHVAELSSAVLRTAAIFDRVTTAANRDVSPTPTSQNPRTLCAVSCLSAPGCVLGV